MPDYPPGYDPSQVDYISASDQAIGGLISIASFAAISVGAFFAGSAITAGIVVNGTTYPGLTLSQAVELDAAWAAVDAALAANTTISVVVSNVITEAALMGGGIAGEIGVIGVFDLTPDERQAAEAMQRWMDAVSGGAGNFAIPDFFFGSGNHHL